jgi:uncharacterized membrane protein
MTFFGTGFGLGAFGLLWFASAVLSIVLIVVLIMLAVRYLNRTSPPAQGQWPGQVAPPPAMPPRPDPLEILRERFARGEITLDDFENAKRALGYPGGPDVTPPGPGPAPSG